MFARALLGIRWAGRRAAPRQPLSRAFKGQNGATGYRLSTRRSRAPFSPDQSHPFGLLLLDRQITTTGKPSLLPCKGKPISLTYRCPCRYFENNVGKSHIKHLKILTIPGCNLQIIARLKNSNKQICIDPKLKWIHEYLEKYLHK
ncbi:stromal cell-derived factor 1 isoform X1 [Hemicordylus capensis]|uniref:stromal cell-derived factor 1 isoform X1 n=1 Tax=Hemicordylus capensis TaxID=884348 RepID=UPI0023045607|nr:stromal cell-derived factor 1 isoform X1 [Hemicordylus capensis]